MFHDPLIYACLGLGLASALVAGVFQSFSDFVMRGLVAAGGGMEAMQMINRTVLRSVFLVLLLGLVPVSIALAIYGWASPGPATGWLVAAAVIYGTGSFLVTIAGNVPMNKRLDHLSSADADGIDYWLTYGRKWTRLNHVRTLASLAAAICYIMAALTLAAGQG